MVNRELGGIIIFLSRRIYFDGKNIIIRQTHVFLTDSVLLTAVLFNGQHYKYLLVYDTLCTPGFHTKFTDINLSPNYGIRKKTYGKV